MPPAIQYWLYDANRNPVRAYAHRGPAGRQESETEAQADAKRHSSRYQHDLITGIIRFRYCPACIPLAQHENHNVMAARRDWYEQAKLSRDGGSSCVFSHGAAEILPLRSFPWVDQS